MTQRTARMLVAWMVFCALWLSALLVYEATTRPPPPFVEIASWLIGVPAAVLIGGLFWTSRKH